MSVIVKNMVMPERCLDCPFMITRDNDDCILQTEVENELARTWEELKASCPLIEIPTPHGRLGDLDNIYVDGEGYFWFSENEAPTIIEAEE